MLLLTVLWILFYFLHSLLASLGVKSFFRKQFPYLYKYYRLGFNLLAVTGFVAIWLYQHSLPEINVIAENSWMNIAGYFLMATGFILGIVALRNYDLSEFAGTQQLRQKFGEEDRGGALVVSGFNNIVRHPLYFSGIIFFAGFLLQSFTNVNLLFVSISVLYLYIGAKLEEHKLEKVFGEEYRKYKRQVKMLIPYLF